MIGLSQWVMIFLIICIVGLAYGIFLMYGMIKTLSDRIDKVDRDRALVEVKVTQMMGQLNNVKVHVDLVDESNLQLNRKIGSLRGYIKQVESTITELKTYLSAMKPTRDTMTWETPIGEFKGEIDSDQLNRTEAPKDAKEIVIEIQKKVKNDSMSEFVKELK